MENKYVIDDILNAVVDEKPVDLQAALNSLMVAKAHDYIADMKTNLSNMALADAVEDEPEDEPEDEDEDEIEDDEEDDIEELDAEDLFTDEEETDNQG